MLAAAAASLCQFLTARRRTFHIYIFCFLYEAAAFNINSNRHKRSELCWLHYYKWFTSAAMSPEQPRRLQLVPQHRHVDSTSIQRVPNCYLAGTTPSAAIAEASISQLQRWTRTLHSAVSFLLVAAFFICNGAAEGDFSAILGTTTLSDM
jgi:hypothetical protein